MLQSTDNPQLVEYSLIHYVMFWNWVKRNFEERGVVFRGAWAK